MVFLPSWDQPRGQRVTQQWYAAEESEQARNAGHHEQPRQTSSLIRAPKPRHQRGQHRGGRHPDPHLALAMLEPGFRHEPRRIPWSAVSPISTSVAAAVRPRPAADFRRPVGPDPGAALGQLVAYLKSLAFDLKALGYEEPLTVPQSVMLACSDGALEPNGAATAGESSVFCASSIWLQYTYR